jgi:hypothetical protein
MKGCKMKDYKTKSDTSGRGTTLIIYKLRSIFWSQIIEHILLSKRFVENKWFT